VIKAILKPFIELIAPRHCEVCRTYIGTTKRQLEFICDRCLDSIPLAPDPSVLMNKLISEFPGDELGISRVCGLFSISEESNFMELIYSLKYKGHSRIGIELGMLLGRRLQILHFFEYDFIIPLPIHHARTRERGYNQSQVIANGISSIINIPVNNSIVKRKKYTQSQTTLKAEERRNNVSQVFGPKKNYLLVSGKKVLLIDDVLTTGSTLNSCANTLLQLGAKQVDAAVLAVA
jgi:ComF family protein